GVPGVGHGVVPQRASPVVGQTARPGDAWQRAGPAARTATASSPSPRDFSPLLALAKTLYAPGSGGANSNRAMPSGLVLARCDATVRWAFTEKSSARTSASPAGW